MTWDFRYHSKECRPLYSRLEATTERCLHFSRCTSVRRVRGAQMPWFYKAPFPLFREGCARFVAKPLRLGWGSEDSQPQLLLLHDLPTFQQQNPRPWLGPGRPQGTGPGVEVRAWDWGQEPRTNSLPSGAMLPTGRMDFWTKKHLLQECFDKSSINKSETGALRFS